MTTRRIEQRGELFLALIDIDSDFDPDEVTSRLKIIPTRVRRRTQSFPSGRTPRISSWCWETPERVESDSELLVQEVLEHFEPHCDTLQALRADLGLHATIGLVISMYGPITTDEHGRTDADIPTPATSFSNETLQRISALGCALDLDQYVIT